jgi:hypothetical protein
VIHAKTAANVICPASNSPKNMVTPEQFFQGNTTVALTSKTYDYDYKINYIHFHGSL